MEFERLTLSDREDLLAFLNEAYRTPGHEPDFENDLPKAFQPTEECMACHLALRDQKGLAAVVGIYPMTLMAGDRRLTVATVGNVATRRDLRGGGLMDALMREALRQCDEAGFQMERLGGLRSRYGRFGFERAGAAYRFKWTARNAKTFGETDPRGKLTLAPMAPGDPLEIAAFRAYQDRSCGVDRIDPATFYRVLKAHFMTPYAAVDASGAFRGYVTAGPDKAVINELFAPDPLDAPALAAAFLTAFDRTETEIFCPSWSPAVSPLALYAESYRVFAPSLFRLHDRRAAAETLLAEKLRRSPLPDASFTFSVEGETLRLGVRQGEAFCEPASGAPDLELDANAATRLLFGPLSPALTLGRPAPAACSVLLPLPLSWDRQDNL